MILGLGAGWHDAEYDAFGFPKDHRVERFEEALRIVVPLLRGETVTFEGDYFTTRDAVLEPPPSRDIPILVAAFGPRMLRLTARYADSWNTAWFGAPDERLRERMDALEAEGRDPATLERTVGIEVRDPETARPAEQDGDDRAFDGSVDELAEALGAYDELGIGHLIVVLQPMTEASLERVALALARR
jgi:alkanesulfonate monooxygenase SsuD/methylene tetrahydromethanopterin reductase-like flavin-dependent oxidoreductase (luciferase family)